MRTTSLGCLKAGTPDRRATGRAAASARVQDRRRQDGQDHGPQSSMGRDVLGAKECVADRPCRRRRKGARGSSRGRSRRRRQDGDIRPGTDGRQRAPENTHNWAVAKFEHDTARPVDGYAAPQLHTHAVFFNMTETRDGDFRAIQSKELYRSQQYGTAVYRSSLPGASRARLRTAGRKERRTRDQGIFTGIPGGKQPSQPADPGPSQGSRPEWRRASADCRAPDSRREAAPRSQRREGAA